MRSTKIVPMLPKRSDIDGERAAKLAHRIIELEMRNHNALLENAIRLTAEETGISHHTLRRMWKYKCVKQPQSVLLGTWERLVQAYQNVCARQLASLKEELDSARELSRHGVISPLVGSAVLVGDSVVASSPLESEPVADQFSDMALNHQPKLS